MIKAMLPALVLWAGAACAEEVRFYGGDLVLSLPTGVTAGREFGQGDAVYALDLVTPTLETIWTEAGRADEVADMDRMEAAFGLSFPSLNCADFTETAMVLPTKCKNAMGMSILVIDRSAPDSGELLGNQMGLLAADVDALWSDSKFDEMLSVFCDNSTHAHRIEFSRDGNSVICTSDRPALAPHFLSFRLLIDADYAVVMYAQNVAAETDVIMTYGVDPFLELIEGATNIEQTLFGLSEAYVAEKKAEPTYLIDVLSQVKRVQ